jgi:hypothetical protein
VGAVLCYNVVFSKRKDIKMENEKIDVKEKDMDIEFFELEDVEDISVPVHCNNSVVTTVE